MPQARGLVVSRRRVAAGVAVAVLTLAAAATARRLHVAAAQPPVVGTVAFSPNTQLDSLAVAGPELLAAAGQTCRDGAGVRCTATVVVSANGGRTWREEPLGGYRAALAAADPRTRTLWLAVQEGSTCVEGAPAPSCPTVVLASADAGRTWRTVLATDWSVTAILPRGPVSGLVALGRCTGTVCEGKLVARVGSGRPWRVAWTGSLWITSLASSGGRRWAVDAGVLSHRGKPATTVQVLRSRAAGPWRVAGTVFRSTMAPPPTYTYSTSLALAGDRAWVGLFSYTTCAIHGCWLNGLFATRTAGRTWTTVAEPPTGPCGVGGLADVATDGRQFWVTGYHKVSGCVPPLTTLFEGQVQTPARVGIRAQWWSDFVSSVAAVGPGDLLALADASIVRSRDGGHTWQELWPAPVPARQVDMLTGGRVGFGLGDGAQAQAVLMTRDGGRTWAVVGTSPVPDVNRIDFVDGRVGFLAAGGVSVPSSLWTTDDGGRQWHRVGPLPGGGMTALSFATARRGTTVAPSGATGAAALYTTDDGGRHWTLRAAGPASLSMDAAAVLAYGRALVLAEGSAYLLAARGGLRRLGREPVVAQLYTAALNGASGRVLVWPVSYSYRPPAAPPPTSAQGASLWTSDDLGRRWTQVRLPGGLDGPIAADFLSARRGWLLVGSFGTGMGTAVLLKTDNGGRTWTVLASG